jgi:hypothetical protein
MEMSGSVLPVSATTPVAPVGAPGSTAAQGLPGAAVQPGTVPAQRPAVEAAAPSAAAPASSATPDAVQRAVARLNQQLAQSGGVKLSVGLDATGQNPGRVLVELSDRRTQQVYFKYYVPAEQLIEAADALSDTERSAPAGTLFRGQA